MSTKTLNVTCTTVPANSQVVVALDSTYGLYLGSQATMDASTGAYLTPGQYRNKWPHPVLKITAKCTTQNMTLTFDILTGVAGAAADWETQGGAGVGSHTITAGTTSTFEWKPLAGDWRVKYTAGADNPDACTVRISMVNPTTDYGS